MSIEIQSNAYASASAYTAATTSAAPVSEETAQNQSSAVAASPNYDTYTVSEEALAVMSEAAEEAGDTDTAEGDVETGTTGSTGTTDTTVDTDTSVDADTTVDTDSKVEDADEEAEEEEVEEESDDMFSDFNSGLDSTNLSSMDAKITLMANQMNTLTTLLNAMNDEDGTGNVASESWVSDASTYSYAGRYLAQSAAGTTGVQQSALEQAEEKEDRVIEYNEFNTTEREDTLSYDEILEKYEVEDANGAFEAMTGTEVK